MSSTLSTLSTTTEVALSKAPNSQVLPGCRSINGCPLLGVHVHGVCSLLCVCTLDGSNAEHKFRVWVTILGRMSRHSLKYIFGVNNCSSWIPAYLLSLSTYVKMYNSILKCLIFCHLWKIL